MLRVLAEEEALSGSRAIAAHRFPTDHATPHSRFSRVMFTFDPIEIGDVINRSARPAQPDARAEG
ncbi:MAG: hypothetical protein HYW57_09320 [Ignavibacteriales bacterium]|nr:hypothetical protein [Ignavibacteriales bacterium]